MRYCLACRRMSADSPICTSCGRSFGGRLCNHKKGRHLNPPDANVCGQCGSATLTEAANYLPFSCLGNLFLCGAFFLGLWLIGKPALKWAGEASGLSHYRDPRVWAVESFARLALPLFILFWVFYGVACFVPGEGGKMLRNAMTDSVKWVVQTLLKLIGGIFKSLGKLLTSSLQNKVK